MKKILVTGSEGILGHALIKNLADREINITGVDIRSRANKLDITDAKKMTSFVKQVQPEIIIHTAAYTDVDGCESEVEKAFLVNAEGAKNIASACRDINAFMLYISTDYVFDGKKKVPYTESDEPNPINVYGKSKLQGEIYIRDMLKRYLVIRTSWLFGNGGKNFVDTIIEKAKAEMVIRVVDDEYGSPTYAVDLATAIVSLLLNSYNLQLTVLNITNSGSCSWYEFAKEIIEIAKIKGVDIKPAASKEIGRPAKRPGRSILDNSNFEKLIGKGMPGWKDAVQRYIKKERI